MAGLEAHERGAAIRLQGVRVQRGGRAILDVPRLDIPPGQVTVLFGPNGAGKTTMLRLIAGLERPDAGLVTLEGEERNGRRDVAFAFQEAVFLRGTVRSNLALGLSLRGVPREASLARLEAAARDCGIAHLLEQDARTLSGGEAQRANLARTIALRAGITLLDEPLAEFDRVGRLAFLDELGRILHALSGAVVLVTHDREEALRLADHMVVLMAGRVVAAAPMLELLQAPPDAETASLLGYTVLTAADGAAIGVPAGGLRLEPGDRCFSLDVHRVLRVGLERRVAGPIRTRRGPVDVEVTLPADAVPPVVGSTISVSAETWVPIENA